MAVHTCSLNSGEVEQEFTVLLRYVVQDPPGLCESQKAKQRGRREGWLLCFLV